MADTRNINTTFGFEPCPQCAGHAYIEHYFNGRVVSTEPCSYCAGTGSVFKGRRHYD